jgi:hypothetical protein
LRKSHVQRLAAWGAVRGRHQYLPNDATVAVILIELDADLLPRYQLAEPLPGSVAERLALLGRVDSCDANSMLHLVRVEDGDRVAIGNLDDGAFKIAGCGVGR